MAIPCVIVWLIQRRAAGALCAPPEAFDLDILRAIVVANELRDQVSAKISFRCFFGRIVDGKEWLARKTVGRCRAVPASVGACSQ